MWKLIATVLEAIFRAIFRKSPDERAERERAKWRCEYETAKKATDAAEQDWRAAVARGDSDHLGLHARMLELARRQKAIGDRGQREGYLD